MLHIAEDTALSQWLLQWCPHHLRVTPVTASVLLLWVVSPSLLHCCQRGLKRAAQFLRRLWQHLVIPLFALTILLACAMDVWWYWLV